MMTKTKKDSYSRLDAEICAFARADKIIMLGDFNARVDSDRLAWSNVIGPQGVGNLNEKGHRLLTLCARNNFFITKTMFQSKDTRKGTWAHPRSKHSHMND